MGALLRAEISLLSNSDHGGELVDTDHVNNSEESVNNAKNDAELSYDFMCGRDKPGDRNEADPGVGSESDPARTFSRSGAARSEVDPSTRRGAAAPSSPAGGV